MYQTENIYVRIDSSANETYVSTVHDVISIVLFCRLSLDATAPVLTPAVLAATKRAGAKPTVHLFACALISNAASFILLISNPANLVLYEGRPSGIVEWLTSFALPSFVVILATFTALAFWFRAEPKQSLAPRRQLIPEFSRGASVVVSGGLVCVIAVMMVVSYFGDNFKIPAFVAASSVALFTSCFQRKVPFRTLAKVSWSVISLVAALFVIVSALNQAGAEKWMSEFFARIQSFPTALSLAAGGFGVGMLSNLLNNPPIGMIAGGAIKQTLVSPPLRRVILLGVDLGPNLSVTGSLSTILWLIAIRQDGEGVRARDFFKVGLLAMPFAMLLAMLLAIAALFVTSNN